MEAVGQELSAASVRAGRYDIVVVIAWMQATCAVALATSARKRSFVIEDFMMADDRGGIGFNCP